MVSSLINAITDTFSIPILPDMKQKNGEIVTFADKKSSF